MRELKITLWRRREARKMELRDSACNSCRGWVGGSISTLDKDRRGSRASDRILFILFLL